MACEAPDRMDGDRATCAEAGRRLCIVIVNYRTAHLVVRCLHSIFEQDAPPAAVFVIDNDSGDGSLGAIARAILAQPWTERVHLLAQPRNGGFAYGCNAGVRAALAEHAGCDTVLFVNPDAELRPGALSRLLAFTRATPQAAIVGGAVEDACGRPQASAHPMPTALTELAGGARLQALSRLLRPRWADAVRSGAPFACDWVTGACFAVRREVFDRIGLLDEAYFLYFEEVDFCARARAAGLHVFHLPGLRAMHLEGAATGIGNAARRRPAYWFDSRRRFFVKHHGAAGLLAADVLWAGGRLSWRLRRLFGLGGRQPADDPPGLMRDLLASDARAALGLLRWRGRRS